MKQSEAWNYSTTAGLCRHYDCALNISAEIWKALVDTAHI